MHPDTPRRGVPDPLSIARPASLAGMRIAVIVAASALVAGVFIHRWRRSRPLADSADGQPDELENLPDLYGRVDREAADGGQATTGGCLDRRRHRLDREGHSRRRGGPPQRVAGR